jgi:hypothetical protein
MPRIPPKMLDSVCYLYADEEHARKGREFGGTGFIVLVPSRTHPGRGYTYAVTNWHVACQKGFSTVRINTMDGGTDVFPFEPYEWHFDPKYDIAVIPLPLRNDLHQFAMVSSDTFLTKKEIALERIGPGEDVFMIGRFVDHDGGLVNQPAVRFGHISVMPTPIEQPNGKMAEAFCIDIHSRTGYSGSPVFMYRTAGFDLEVMPPRKGQNAKLLFDGARYLGIIGIHFSQFPELWELMDGVTTGGEGFGEPLIRDGKYIRGLSGMTCVLPAWTIMEVLDLPNLKEQREMQDRLYSNSRLQPMRPDAEASAELYSEEESKERFERTLKAALNTLPESQRDLVKRSRSDQADEDA